MALSLYRTGKNILFVSLQYTIWFNSEWSLMILDVWIKYPEKHLRNYPNVCFHFPFRAQMRRIFC